LGFSNDDPSVTLSREAGRQPPG